MKNNPQINNFLDIGIKRFAARGIDGIKIDEICVDVGVAKSSFYHYFGSKKGFIDKLFDHWFEVTHGTTIDEITKIADPYERLRRLKEIIDSNMEIEYFFLQLKLFALTNEKAREVIERASKSRYETVCQIFKDAGQTDEQASNSTHLFTMIYYGRVALMHGYTGSIDKIDISEEQLFNALNLT